MQQGRYTVIYMETRYTVYVHGNFASTFFFSSVK